MRKSAKFLLIIVSVLVGQVPAIAQEVVLDLPHIYPPEGQRLKDLAKIAGLQIGYASRDQFNESDHEARYDRIVRGEFDIVTPENSNKWENMHPEPDTYLFSSMDNLVSFAETNGMALHGHPLIWHQLNPEWIEMLPANQVEAAMNDHIDTVMSRYAGKIQAWDVVNEGLEDTVNGGGFRETLWFDALGESYIDKAFIRARAADPAAELIYNDYDVGWLNPKSDEMYTLLTRLLNDGVPLDAVGFQMHLKTGFTDYDGFTVNMQRFADLGLDIYITELDVQIADQVLDETALAVEYDLQADVYEKVTKRCLAQPRCKALQVWGVNDYYSWLPWFDPLLFDNQYNVKPAYYGLQRALSTSTLHPESAVSSFGTESGNGLVSIDSGETAVSSTMPAWVGMGVVDLRAGFQRGRLRYRNDGTAPASISVRQDALDGTVLAEVVLPPTTGFVELTTPLTMANTESPVFIVFGDAAESIAIDYLLLEQPVNAIQPSTGTTTGSTTDGSTTDGSTTDGSTTDGSSTDSGGGSLFWLSLVLVVLRTRRLNATVG